MPPVNVTRDGFVRYARAKFGALADEFLRLYPAATDDEAAAQSNAAANDNSRVSTWLWATEWVKGSKRPTYTYFWTHAPPGPDDAMRGAFHGSEIPYAFGNLETTDRPWTDEDHRIAKRMSSYWANIIKTGDPNGPGLPRWPAFDAHATAVMELGKQWTTVPVASAERIAFWRGFFETQTPW